jgi:hypothetical protein
MKADNLKNFLKEFDLSNKKIDEFYLGKKLEIKNNNVFLVEEKFDSKTIFKDTLLFIKLKKMMISSYFLDYLRDNTKDVLEIKTEKSALKFTYGKPLDFTEVNAKFMKLNSNRKYIVTYLNKSLGYVSLENKKLRNKMNVGDYLRED